MLLQLQGCRKRGGGGGLGHILPTQYYEPPPGFPDLATALNYYICMALIFSSIAYGVVCTSNPSVSKSWCKLGGADCTKPEFIFLSTSEEHNTDSIYCGCSLWEDQFDLFKLPNKSSQQFQRSLYSIKYVYCMYLSKHVILWIPQRQS